MLGSNTNVNTAVCLVVDGKEHPLQDATPAVREEPLPRVRQVLLTTESPVSPTKKLPAVQSAVSGPGPTLDEFADQWRRGKGGLKPATEAKLDDCLKIARRHVDI